MEKDKGKNTAQILAEALEQERGSIPPQVENWFKSLSIMKEFFKKLPKSSLSQESQNKLFEIIEEAWMVCFEENPKQRKIYLEQLYKSLTQVPLTEFSNTMTIFQTWANDQKDLLSKKDLFSGLQIYARIAHECDKEEFIDAFNNDELPPIELSESEMEMLNGGVRLVKLKKALLQLPKAFAQL